MIPEEPAGRSAIFDTEEDESKKMNTETVTVTHKAAAIYSSFQERLVYKKNKKRLTKNETIKSD